MKRFIGFFVLALAGVLLIATAAYAGVWDRFTDIAFDKLFGVVITGVFALLSMFLGSKVLKYRQIATEGKDFGVWVYEATRENSPGGAKITGAELDVGLKEFGELSVAIAAIVAKKQE